MGESVVRRDLPDRDSGAGSDVYAYHASAGSDGAGAESRPKQ